MLLNIAGSLLDHCWIVDEEGNVSIDWINIPSHPLQMKYWKMCCVPVKGFTLDRCTCRKANLQNAQPGIALHNFAGAIAAEIV